MRPVGQMCGAGERPDNQRSTTSHDSSDFGGIGACPVVGVALSKAGCVLDGGRSYTWKADRKSDAQSAQFAETAETTDVEW